MKKSNQSGSAHVVIIIILAVVVLGLVGYVFWNNFLKAKTTPTTKVATTSTTTNGTSDSTKTLAITEWGIKGTYTGDTPLTYKIDRGFAWPSTDGLTGDCTESSALQRATANDVVGVDQTGTTDPLTAAKFYNDSAPYTNPNDPNKTPELKSDGYVYWAQAHIGNYYYFYLTPQAECSSNDSVNNTVATVDSETTQFLNSAVATN